MYINSQVKNEEEEEEEENQMELLPFFMCADVVCLLLA